MLFELPGPRVDPVDVAVDPGEYARQALHAALRTVGHQPYQTHSLINTTTKHLC